MTSTRHNGATPQEERMNRNPLLIVVNADDLGASTTINAAIFAALADKAITSATIMSNGPCFDEAVAGLRHFPEASFGVHLNLTEFSPLTSDPNLRPILDQSGNFRRDGICGISWSPGLQRAVINEWRTQISRAMEAGVPVSHLDSHHHTHTLPHLFPALKSVQRHFNLRRVRGTWSIYDRASMPPLALRAKKRAWLWALRHLHSTRTTDEFAGLCAFAQAVREGTFAPANWPRSIEIMVHPDSGPQGDAIEAQLLRGTWTEYLNVASRMVPYYAL
jgi:predicted glycoside hydrolase/deacetylase ChbG (UPF0249 family)